MGEKTKAEMIREVANQQGYHHTNHWIKGELARRYGVNVSIQQVSQVLGRMKDRRNTRRQEIDRCCVRFLAACHNDINLAKSVLLDLNHQNEE